MNKIALIFPHQLFEENPFIQKGYEIHMVEETLFFNQYAFHKQKLAFHRATMKFYEKYLHSKNLKVNYIDAHSSLSDVRNLLEHLDEQGVEEIHIIDPTDNWLEKRISKKTAELKLALTIHNSPLFLTKKEDLQPFFRPDKKKFFQTSFYIEQRKHYKILLENGENPKGGKWSFDDENRKKYPKRITPPTVYPEKDAVYKEAFEYIKTHFADNPGQLGENPLYPFNYSSAKKWLEEFLEIRFSDFGTYEDAIVKEESILHHSVLTPMLNVGLLTPDFVIDRALEFAQSDDIPINSVEGFIRQIIGWREFIRGIYEAKGSEQRTKNYWNFSRKIPKEFYTGTTGIPPIDHTIRKVMKTGYCHHIERLMVLGSFMMLCEFDPDEVYRWFMELFIDAYDWVMVPNVYGMSQFADGGLMSTKPYISSSNYLMKMSNYEKGNWQEIWDGLFWRFMHVHRDFFTQNPRLGMLVKTLDKMDDQKKGNHLRNAEFFLNGLSN